jgi:hypothetical protein
MQINIIYDSSVDNAPAGFTTGVMDAVQYLENEFTNPVTLTIDVGYGEIDGQSLGDDLGESQTVQELTESYSVVRDLLVNEGVPGAATLPATSPITGTLEVNQAEAKALGLPGDYESPDGYVGFSSTLPFSYADGTAPPSGDYYFIGAVEHEITEDMGRVSLLDERRTYAPIDLFRYSAAGVRDTTTGGNGSTAYFSIDNGDTDLGTWNNQTSNGDLADWYGSNIPNHGDDSFDDYSPSGVVNIVSQSDITLMQAIGWSTTSAAVFRTPEDFVGAGTSDLLFQNTAGSYASWETNGGSVIGGGNIGSPGTGWSFEDTGYFDDSKNSDILFENTGGTYADWEMNGTSVSGVVTLGNPGAGWSFMGVGDFNGDGYGDILFENSGGSYGVWQTNGTSVTGSGNIGSPGPGWTFAAVGYLDTGANSDVLFENTAGAYAVWDMNGLSINAVVTLGSPGAGWTFEGIGDFYGNGSADLLFQNTAGSYAIWETNGSSVIGGGNLGSPGSGWSFAGIGDYIGNGTSDILFSSTAGTYAAWEMNGTTIANVVTFGSPGPSWMLQHTA